MLIITGETDAADEEQGQSLIYPWMTTTVLEGELCFKAVCFSLSASFCVLWSLRDLYESFWFYNIDIVKMMLVENLVDAEAA